MAEDWAGIAAEVDAAIRSVADVSQPNGYPATLRRAGAPSGDAWNSQPGEPTFLTVYVLEEFHQQRDAAGTMIDRPIHRLVCSAQPGVVPNDNDEIALGVAREQVDDGTVWISIDEVRPLAPAGVAVLYEIDLVR